MYNGSSMPYLLPRHTGALNAGTARRALLGFFLSGLLVGLPGALLPAWGHHLQSSFLWVAFYFFSLNFGVLLANLIAQLALPRFGTGAVLSLAALIGAISLGALAFTSTPMSGQTLRAFGLFGAGIAAGLANTAIFEAITSIYRHDAASTTNIAGLLFTLGSMTTALVLAQTFYAYSVAVGLLLLATIPVLMTVLYARTEFQPVEPIPHPPQAIQDFRKPAAILFALLLFFQFGNEWSIAGWLPIFLIQRLGISPETALKMLAFYWFALLVGRTVAQAILPRFNHARLLFASVLASMFGCLILGTTNNLQGAFVGILLIGASFAPIYPIVVEKLGDRFPYYHPAFLNGIFAVAMSGGMLAPAGLGLMAHYFQIQVMIVVPFVGSLMVFLLIFLIWLESKLQKLAARE